MNAVKEPAAPPGQPQPLAGVRACFAFSDPMEIFELKGVFEGLGGSMVKVADMASATHCVFDGGNPNVYLQAKDAELKIVSKSWVQMCAQAKMRLSEDFAPAQSPVSAT